MTSNPMGSGTITYDAENRITSAGAVAEGLFGPGGGDLALLFRQAGIEMDGFAPEQLLFNWIGPGQVAPSVGFSAAPNTEQAGQTDRLAIRHPGPRANRKCKGKIFQEI